MDENVIVLAYADLKFQSGLLNHQTQIYNSLFN